MWAAFWRICIWLMWKTSSKALCKYLLTDPYCKYSSTADSVLFLFYPFLFRHLTILYLNSQLLKAAINNGFLLSSTFILSHLLRFQFSKSLASTMCLMLLIPFCFWVFSSVCGNFRMANCMFTSARYSTYLWHCTVLMIKLCSFAQSTEISVPVFHSSQLCR